MHTKKVTFDTFREVKYIESKYHHKDKDIFWWSHVDLNFFKFKFMQSIFNLNGHGKNTKLQNIQ